MSLTWVLETAVVLMMTMLVVVGGVVVLCPCPKPVLPPPFLAAAESYKVA